MSKKDDPNLSPEVKIREVSPRDGFQSWPEFIPTEKKIEVVRSAVAAGLTEIEVTSFVNPKAIPQMRDAAAVLAGIPPGEAVRVALVPNLKGAELAFQAGVDQLQVFISASEEHNRANVRRSIADSLADLDGIFSLARAQGVPVQGAVAVSFGCPYKGDVDQADVLRVAEAYLDKGADSVILADTTGMAVPPKIESMVRAFQKSFPGVEYGLHLHNNRGTAMANLYAALEAGARVFDTALGGIGGCPNVPQASGNLATEDVVCMLEEMGVSTGLDLIALIRAAHRLEEILGHTLPGQVMRSGPRDPKLAAAVCGIGTTIKS